MSRAWAGGSTRSWRALRGYVLDRDGWRCQVPTTIRAGAVLERCGKVATTAGHITAKVDGGTDTPGNLRAECTEHNYSDGGRLAALRRNLKPATVTARRWTW